MTWQHWYNPNEAGWRLDAKAQAMNYKQPPWSERYRMLFGTDGKIEREESV